MLLSKTYESEKELVAPKKGKIRVSGFKQFVAVVDTPNGTCFIIFKNYLFYFLKRLQINDAQCRSARWQHTQVGDQLGRQNGHTELFGEVEESVQGLPGTLNLNSFISSSSSR